MKKFSALFLVVFVLTGACRDAKTGATKVEIESLRGVPLGSDKLPTTHFRIYVANLESRIEFVEDQVAAGPSVSVHLELAELYQQRFSYDANLQGLSDAVQQLDIAIALEESQGKATSKSLLLAAHIALGLHQFSRSQGFVDRAKQAGARANLLAEVQQELDWSQGKASLAMSSVRTAATKEPNLATLTRLAVLEHQLGNFYESQRLFEQAELQVRGTSPFTLAWLNLQRGNTFLDRGEIEEAVLFLRESVRRLPVYSNARLHLAEVLATQGGHSAEVFEIYGELAKEGEPEAMSKYSHLLIAAGDTEAGSMWAERAQQRFAQLIAKYPSVMALHGSDYYGANDRGEQAVELLRRNVSLQPNGESYTLLAEHQHALGRQDAAMRSMRAVFSGEYIPVRAHEIAKDLCEKQDLRPLKDCLRLLEN